MDFSGARVCTLRSILPHGQTCASDIYIFNFTWSGAVRFRSDDILMPGVKVGLLVLCRRSFLPSIKKKKGAFDAITQARSGIRRNKKIILSYLSPVPLNRKCFPPPSPNPPLPPSPSPILQLPTASETWVNPRSPNMNWIVSLPSSLLRVCVCLCTSSVVLCLRKLCHLYDNLRRALAAPALPLGCVVRRERRCSSLCVYDFNLCKLPCHCFSLFLLLL